MASYGQLHVYERLLAIKLGQTKFIPIQSKLLATHYKRAKGIEPTASFKAEGCGEGALVTRIS